MTEEIIEKYIQRIEERLSNVETYIDLARDDIQDLLNVYTISDEVYSFIENLMDNPNIPEEIQNKAGELWQKI